MRLLQFTRSRGSVRLRSWRLSRSSSWNLAGESPVGDSRSARSSALRNAWLSLPGVSASLPAGYFFENVENTREILLCAFEFRFGQALLGFKFCDPCRFFDNGAPVLRLVAEDLADTALLDNGVAFRS